MNDLRSGLNGFGQALGFAFRNGMGWMFLVPVLVWLLFATGVFALGLHLTELVMGLAETHLGIEVPTTDRTGWQGFQDDLLAVVNGARGLLVWLVIKLGLLYLFSLTGKYVVLILLSPLLAYASERTEEVLTGHQYPFRLAQLLKDTVRGIAMALRNGLLELLINVLAWVSTLFLPVAAPITAFLLIAVSSWFYGFSMFDYVFERQRLGIGASLRAARRRKGLVLGNGFAFWLLMRVPFVSWVVAPLLGAIGAVLAWHQAERLPQPPVLPLR